METERRPHPVLNAKFGPPAVRFSFKVQGRMEEKFFGHSVIRKEGREKVTGRARYVDDLTFPGMLHGVTVRSSVPRGPGCRRREHKSSAESRPYRQGRGKSGQRSSSRHHTRRDQKSALFYSVLGAQSVDGGRGWTCFLASLLTAQDVKRHDGGLASNQAPSESRTPRNSTDWLDSTPFRIGSNKQQIFNGFI